MDPARNEAVLDQTDDVPCGLMAEYCKTNLFIDELAQLMHSSLTEPQIKYVFHENASRKNTKGTQYEEPGSEDDIKEDDDGDEEDKQKELTPEQFELP